MCTGFARAQHKLRHILPALSLAMIVGLALQTGRYFVDESISFSHSPTRHAWRHGAGSGHTPSLTRCRRAPRAVRTLACTQPAREHAHPAPCDPIPTQNLPTQNLPTNLPSPAAHADGDGCRSRQSAACVEACGTRPNGEAHRAQDGAPPPRAAAPQTAHERHERHERHQPLRRGSPRGNGTRRGDERCSERCSYLPPSPPPPPPPPPLPLPLPRHHRRRPLSTNRRLRQRLR